MYQFHFTMLTIRARYLCDGNVPKYKTSALRGSMGQMLLDMYCVGDQTKCQECFCKNRCIVQNIMFAPFQIKPDFVTDKESGGYCISCTDTKEQVRAGDEFEIRLILYGDTVVYLNPMIQAIFGAGQKGLGKERIPFEMSAIRNRRGEDILLEQRVFYDRVLVETAQDYIRERREEISPETGIRMEFVSPCTLKYQGEILQEFRPDAVLHAVLRKVTMQHLFEGMVTDPMLIHQMPRMTGQWAEEQKVPRYSGRQHSRMTLSGITGYMELEEVDEAVLRLLLAGEITQIGKNSRFGFGVYRLRQIDE